MDLPSDILLNNRYRILSKLGQGGMGAVYLAMDTALEHQVAVKANLNPAPDSASKFLREARLLASLRHPNLPRVTDYFINDTAQYLVMDYIPGKDLDTIIKESGPQPLEKVLAWANQLGSAIHYLHQQSPPVIHRDIKPANVRLGSDNEAMLVDFGIAKVDNPAATSTGFSGYTPGYAPPEQYSDASRTGPYTDQYAFAALLYQLLTGVRPVDAIQRMMGQEALIPISKLRPEVPDHIGASIEKALSLKPEDRFASISDMLRAIQTNSAQEPTGRPPAVVQPPEMVRATIQENTPSAPVNSVSNQPIFSDQTRVAFRPTSTQKSRPRLLWIIGTGALSLACLAVLGLLALWQPGLLSGLSTSPTSQAALLPGSTKTPQPEKPTFTLELAPTAQPSPTPEPSHTIQPSPSQTVTTAPTDTASPEPTATETLAPSPTSPPLGQGGLIAFASDRAGDSVLQIWTMRVSLNNQGLVEASDYTQLTFGPGDKTYPTWSPDGKRLLFVAEGSESTGLDIWVTNADGSAEPINLTNRKGDDTEPAWSADGQWISFTNNGREDKIRQVYVMEADGSDPYRLSYDQEEFGTTWSPNMKWLGFVMNAAGAHIMFLRPPSDPKIPDGRPYYATPQRFDMMDVVGNLGHVNQPAWSPDGNWLAYMREIGLKQQIWLARYPITRPDQDVIQLTNGNADTRPAWSPDSQWIVYTSRVGDNFEIFIMRSTGQSQINLTNSPSIDRDPSWQILLP